MPRRMFGMKMGPWSQLALIAGLVVAMLASILVPSPVQAVETDSPMPEDLLMYDNQIGRGLIREVTPTGALGGSWQDGWWRKSWTVVMPIDVNGNGIDEMFFYEASSGTAKIHDVTRAGELGDVMWETSSWRRTWHSIITLDVDSDGADELFMYDRVNGHVKMFDVKADGKVAGAPTYSSTKWRKSWDMFRSVDVNGNSQDELVMYDASREQVIIYDITDAGKFGGQFYNQKRAEFRNLKDIEVLDFGGNGNEDLLLYGTNGAASIWDVAPNGRSMNQVFSQNWRRTWESITAIDVDRDGTDELFFYEPSKNYAKVHDVTGGGRLGRKLSEMAKVEPEYGSNDSSPGIEAGYDTIEPIRLDRRRPNATAHKILQGSTRPTKPILNVHTDGNRLGLSWAYQDSSTRDDHGVAGYKLWIDGALRDTYGPNSHSGNLPLGSGGVFHFIDGLTAGRTYHIKVVVFDHDGMSNTVTRQVTLSSDEGTPSPVDPSGPDSGTQDTTPPTWGQNPRAVQIGSSNFGVKKIHFTWSGHSDYNDAGDLLSVKEFELSTNGFERVVSIDDLAAARAEKDNPSGASNIIDLRKIPTWVEVPGPGTYDVGIRAVDYAGNKSTTLMVRLTFNGSGGAVPVEPTGEEEVAPEPENGGGSSNNPPEPISPADLGGGGPVEVAGQIRPVHNSVKCPEISAVYDYRYWTQAKILVTYSQPGTYNIMTRLSRPGEFEQYSTGGSVTRPGETYEYTFDDLPENAREPLEFKIEFEHLGNMIYCKTYLVKSFSPVSKGGPNEVICHGARKNFLGQTGQACYIFFDSAHTEARVYLEKLKKSDQNFFRTLICDVISLPVALADASLTSICIYSGEDDRVADNERKRVFGELENGLKVGHCLVVAVNEDARISEPFRSTVRSVDGRYNPWCSETYTPKFFNLSDFLLEVACVANPDIDISQVGILLPDGESVYSCQAAIAALEAMTPFERLRYGHLGVAPYKSFNVGCTASGDCQRHHLIEQRFRDLFSQSTNEWLAVVLTPQEHRVFTNAWRQELPRGGTYTREEVWSAAWRIYADYPEIVKPLYKSRRGMGAGG